MEEQKYFAAIDIGTNAGRLLIGYVIPQRHHFSVKKALLTRVPLRLGEDVFSSGKISAEKEARFNHAIKGFKHLMKAYNVEDYRAVATSAMREASNGPGVAMKLLQSTGINLDIIGGAEEARLIFSTFRTQKLNQDESYLFIDVGGGSTELTLIKQGERLFSKSFKVGTLRSLNGKVDAKIWDQIKKWVKEKGVRDMTLSAIGTGGNANRLVKMQGRDYLEPINRQEIEDLRNHVASFKLKDRIEKLRLKPDRADVIVPAADIYARIMRFARIDDMLVPKMGLADGIIFDLYERSLK